MYRINIQRLRSDKEIGKQLIIPGNTELPSCWVSFASFPCKKAQLEVIKPEHLGVNI